MQKYDFYVKSAIYFGTFAHMAILQKIIISDFRNIEFAELSFVGGVNCICGDNGQGKTNLLDAIYYLSMTKSAFGTSDQFCVRHGLKGFSIAGTYLMQDSLSSKYVVSVSESGKSVRRDDKAMDRISDHIGRLPVVMVSPQDSALVSESGDERRRFVNAVLSQMNPEYLAAVQKYNRLLSQRNKILKDAAVQDDILDVLDSQMAGPAAYISACRNEFASKLEEAVARYYAELSGGREKVGIAYRSDVYSEGDINAIADAFYETLRSSRSRDRMLKYSGSGIQRDDFLFSMDGHPIRRCGSQGQQKSFLVALKLAQYDIMKKDYGFPPILLLDDVFDKLDLHRISNLLKIVSRNDYGQIFISDTNRSRMEEIVSEIAPDAAFFDARNGQF